MQAQSYYSKIRVYQNSQGILMGYQFLESLNYVALNEVQSENYWLKEWRKWEAHGIISDNIPLWCWYLYPHVKPVDVAGSTCIKEWNSRCWIQLRLSWRNFPHLMMFLLGFFFFLPAFGMLRWINQDSWKKMNQLESTSIFILSI